MRGIRGFTLVEALLAAALSLCLLTLLVSVLVPTMRASQRGTAQVALQQSALVVVEQLYHDLQRAPWAGLSQAVADPLRMLAVHRLGQVASDGAQVFEDHVVVYQWHRDTRQVVRKLVVPTAAEFSTAAPYAFGANALVGLAAVPGKESRVLAGQVETFEVKLLPDHDEQSQMVQLRVGVATHVQGREDDERVELKRTLHLRNQTL